MIINLSVKPTSYCLQNLPRHDLILTLMLRPVLKNSPGQEKFIAGSADHIIIMIIRGFSGNHKASLFRLKGLNIVLKVSLMTECALQSRLFFWTACVKNPLNMRFIMKSLDLMIPKRFIAP